MNQEWKIVLPAGLQSRSGNLVKEEEEEEEEEVEEKKEE